jgi:RHS repeat-associated protein
VLNAGFALRSQSPYGWNGLFTGREFGPETTHGYYRSRFYEPLLGRFLSRDAVNDDVNAYRYVANRPLTKTDPSGFAPCPGGYWTVSSGEFWFAGFLLTTINVELSGYCTAQPRLACHNEVSAWGAGVVASIGAAYQIIVGDAYDAPDSNDLLGWSILRAYVSSLGLFSVGAVFASVTASGAEYELYSSGLNWDPKKIVQNLQGMQAFVAQGTWK